MNTSKSVFTRFSSSLLSLLKTSVGLPCGLFTKLSSKALNLALPSSFSISVIERSLVSYGLMLFSFKTFMTLPSSINFLVLLPSTNLKLIHFLPSSAFATAKSLMSFRYEEMSSALRRISSISLSLSKAGFLNSLFKISSATLLLSLQIALALQNLHHGPLLNMPQQQA